MNNKVSVGATITISVMVAAVVFSITMIFSRGIYNSKLKNVDIRVDMFSKIEEIDRVVNQSYIGEFDRDSLVDNTAAGYMAGLGDPYAEYLNIEETKRLNAELSGALVGIGVKIRQDEAKYMLVTEVWKDSPAEAAGLQVNDRIIKVADYDVLSNYADAEKALSGLVSDVVSITYRRDTTDQVIDITRKAMNVPTVYFKMIDEVAFIRITNFHDNTPEQFRAAISAAQAANAKGYVFDVRDNTGGTLDSLVAILDILLPQGTIMTVEFSNGEIEVYSSSPEELQAPMVVLANANTSSSAELFVASLKEYGKAQMVGELTTGKGVMQQLKPLNDGSSIRITYATFYPASGKSFNGIGVQPDFESKMPSQIYDVWKYTPFDQLLAGTETDPQLFSALELVRSSIKAGNSGIGVAPTPVESSDEELLPAEPDPTPQESGETPAESSETAA